MKIIETVRDAMQGVDKFIPTKSKIEYINLLLNVGFDVIDFSSFVSKKAIPQLSDVEEVLDGLNTDNSNTKLLTLVGNETGCKMASKYDTIDYIAYPFSMSETFLKYNLNSNFEKSTKAIEFIQNMCVKTGKELHLYFSMSFGNPYGDKWNTDMVFEWLEFFQNKMDINIITFSDPAAMADSATTTKLFSQFQKEYKTSVIDIGVHIHSEPNNWYELVDAAYKAGCERFDTVINGFGGCPMAKKRLVGNLKTGNLLHYLDEQGDSYSKKLNFDNYNSALEMADKIFI